MTPYPKFSLALIPGDGIGPELLEAALLPLRVVAARHSLEFEETTYDWSSERYLRTGAMMPEVGVVQLRRHDAILLGAVGWPELVPDSVTLHGLLLPIRKKLDLFANVRPHRLLPGITGPLRKEGFDILCVRENTEGEYSGAGGRVHQGEADEVAVETAVFTRRSVERILRYAFERASQRSGQLASVTKSNAQMHSMVFWDEVTDEVAQDYPGIEVSRYHVDAIAARIVTHPESLDVILASNLFGDILSDVGAAIQGGLGFAASANVNPSIEIPSMFEPVHGSAPDIAERGLANPFAAVWSASLMLDHLGEHRAARDLFSAMAVVSRNARTLTPDCGGTSSTREVAEAIADAVAEQDSMDKSSDE